MDQSYQFGGRGIVPQPPFPILSVRSPFPSDITSPSGAPYLAGQLWQNTLTDSFFIYEGAGNWILLSSGTGSVETLTGNIGIPVVPTAGNINVLGGLGISTSGTASTLTLSNTLGLSPFVVGPTGNFISIQAAITAANAVGGGVIYVQAGTYTENLTFFPNINLVGAIGQVDAHICTIVGTHTPAISGQFSIYGIWLTGATAVFSSSAAGSCQFNFFNVICEITGVGFTWDLPNWTGQINIFDFLQTNSGTNGCINNPTGTMGVVIINSAIGLTQINATALINGPVEWDNMLIGIKCQYGGSGNININGGCQFLNTQIFTGSTTSTIVDSSFQTGSNAALTTSSSGTISLAAVNISSSASPAIQGTGTVILEDVSFVQNNGIAGALTITPGGGTRSTSFQVGATNVQILSGVGSPNGSVTAPKGSLFLATNGSGVGDRAFINTNGATAWTAITTAS